MDRRISTAEAERLISCFIPMFEYLNSHDVPYCVVGGLGVMLHTYCSGEEAFRATEDADIMFDDTFTNKDFAEAYLATYASDPQFSRRVYEAVFGEGAFKTLDNEEEAFVNTSFIGATSELDGVDTPNFDVVRLLNARRLSDLDMTVLTVDGIAIKVATVDQLERMKRDTIGILKVGYADSPRPQDFEDLAQLERIRQRGRGRR